MKLRSETRIECFEPIIDEKSRILILGTMPSVNSLLEKMYYASKKNHFWDLMYRILIPDYPPYQPFDISIPKDERYKILLSKSIALWDVISDCTRTGSNDKEIKDERFNDINQLIQKNNIKVIICNGKEALKFLKKSGQLKKINIQVITINSSSSLNPNNTFTILNEWKYQIDQYI